MTESTYDWSNARRPVQAEFRCWNFFQDHPRDFEAWLAQAVDGYRWVHTETQNVLLSANKRRNWIQDGRAKDEYHSSLDAESLDHVPNYLDSMDLMNRLMFQLQATHSVEWYERTAINQDKALSIILEEPSISLRCHSSYYRPPDKPWGVAEVIHQYNLMGRLDRDLEIFDDLL